MYAFFQTAPAGIWPITVSGWFTLGGIVLGALFGGGGAVYAWGKWTQTINGFGERVKNELDGFGERVAVVEERLGYADARDAQLQKNIDAVLNQHANMLEKLGEAKRSAEKCSEDMDGMTHRIEAKLDTVRDVVNRIDKELSSKVAALEATGRRLKHDTT